MFHKAQVNTCHAMLFSLLNIWPTIETTDHHYILTYIQYSAGKVADNMSRPAAEFKRLIVLCDGNSFLSLCVAGYASYGFRRSLTLAGPRYMAKHSFRQQVCVSYKRGTLLQSHRPSCHRQRQERCGKGSRADHFLPARRRYRNQR